jgi:hypothetical protein
MSLDLPMLKSIRRLLRAGVRHAEIARRFDLAVGTINRISSERKLRRVKLHLLTEADLPEDDAPPDYLAANLRRCEGCGGMVYHWPCMLCHIRAAQAAGIVLPDEEEDCIAATTGRGDDEGESGGEGEWEQGEVGEGARSEVASLRTEYQVLSTQYQVPSNPFSRSPPLPLSLSPSHSRQRRLPMPAPDPLPDQIPNSKSPIPSRPPRTPPELFQIVIECAGETQQRDLFDRLRREGLKLRLLVL